MAIESKAMNETEAEPSQEMSQRTVSIRYHRQLAEVAVRARHAYAEAAIHYETAVGLFQEQPDLLLATGERADLFYQQAEVLETMGQIDAALAAYRLARNAADRDPVRWARCQRSIAWLLCRQGEPDQATLACEQALAALDGQPDEEVRAELYRTSGMIEILRGRYQSARAYIQRALEFYSQGPPSEGLARCFDYMAQICHDEGDLEAMLSATRRSRAVAETLGDPVSIGHALNNVAYALVLLGRNRQALPLLYRAATLFEKHHVEKHLPSLYHSLAAALLKSGQAEEALSYLERGLDKAHRMGEVRTLVELHRLSARRAAATSQPDEAHAHFSTALKMCASSGLNPQHVETLQEFSEFLRQVGEPEEASRLRAAAAAIRRRTHTGTE
jgi:tetratricopeptide (TPR) repeat protein